MPIGFAIFGADASAAARPGAPWELAVNAQWPVEGRHDASGTIMDGQSAAIPRAGIVRNCTDKVLHHLTIACAWPEDWAQRLEVVGAYRFYVIEFWPRPGFSLCIFRFGPKPATHCASKFHRRTGILPVKLI